MAWKRWFRQPIMTQGRFSVCGTNPDSDRLLPTCKIQCTRFPIYRSTIAYHMIEYWCGKTTLLTERKKLQRVTRPTSWHGFKAVAPRELIKSVSKAVYWFRPWDSFQIILASSDHSWLHLNVMHVEWLGSARIFESVLLIKSTPNRQIMLDLITTLRKPTTNSFIQ